MALEPNPTSYPIGTGRAFPVGKAAGEWNWPLTPSSAEVKEWVELNLHSPILSFMAWCLVKYRDNFTLPLTLNTKKVILDFYLRNVYDADCLEIVLSFYEFVKPSREQVMPCR
jgi:hypothetical protein